jgi:hypothetical protein
MDGEIPVRSSAEAFGLISCMTNDQLQDEDKRHGMMGEFVQRIKCKSIERLELHTKPFHRDPI